MPFPLIPFLVGAAAGAALTYWYNKPDKKEDGLLTQAGDKKSGEADAKTDE